MLERSDGNPPSFFISLFAWVYSGVNVALSPLPVASGNVLLVPGIASPIVLAFEAASSFELSLTSSLVGSCVSSMVSLLFELLFKF
jgi:hypothetical protein